jgi:hypothetical protein
MTDDLDDGSIRLLVGDCRARLRELPDRSVHCCVTSPPYWGLRDYGTASWEGGDPACEHRVGDQVSDSKAPGAITTGQCPGADASACRRCGARRVDAQIGLERTPEGYVAELVAVLREVRRVLRDDGTLWLNLGDSYAARWGSKRSEGRAGLLQTNASAAIDALVAERVAPICCACGRVQRIGGVIAETGIGGVGVEPVSVADLPEGWVVGAFAQSTGRLGVGDVESGVSVGEVGGAAPFALCPACFRAGSRAVEQALEPLAARRGRS